MTKTKKYRFLLFVTDNQPNSARAKRNIKSICRANLADDFHLRIIDVFQEPDLALEHRVYVTPMLVKAAPPPPAYVVGDMSDTQKVLAVMGIENRTETGGDTWEK